MSKKSFSTFPPSKINEDEDEEDDEDVVVSPKLTNNYKKPKPEQKQHRGGINDSFSSKNLKNSHERDSFLNAFLDRDVNMKHEPLTLKSHHDAQPKESAAPPKPRPRPPRNDADYKEEQQNRGKSPTSSLAATTPKMNYKAGGEGDKKDEYDHRKKSSFDVPDLLKQQSANRSADVGKNEFSKASHNLQKPLKQDRPTPKSPHEAVSTGEELTRNSKQDMLRNDITRDDNAVNKQTPVKSPRTDFMSLKPKKDQFEQSRQNHKSQSSFQQDVPTKSQQPVKSPRPTSQLQLLKPTKPTKHFSEKPEKINTEANLKQDYNEPVKKERPTKSPRPLANHNDQQKEGIDKFTKKSLDGEVAYSKNLSKFNDLMGSGSGGSKSKDEKTTARKNEKQSFEKPQKDHRKDEEIDSLFDIGGKSSTVKKSYKVDDNVEPDYRHRKTVEDRRENKAGFDFEKSHQGKIERERVDDRDDVEKKRKEPTTTPKHRNETDDPLSRRGEIKSDRSKSTNARESREKSEEESRSPKQPLQRREKFEEDSKMQQHRQKLTEKEQESTYPPRKERFERNINPSTKKHHRREIPAGEEETSPSRNLDRRQKFSEKEERLQNNINIKHSSKKPHQFGSRDDEEELMEDEQLDSLFDAGFKRSSSAKKERVKSDKLNDHVRRSNDQILRHRKSRDIGDDEDDENLSRTTTTTKMRDDKRTNSANKKKPGPMKANLSMNEVTKSPALKKEATATTPKKSRPLSSSHRVKSNSLTNISNLISPRSNSPITYDDVSNMDGKTLRDHIYLDWLQRKRSFTKEESKIRKEKQAKETEESERKAHERRVDAQKSFEAWGGKKEEAIKSKRQDSKKKEQTLKEQEDEKLQKAKDAKKFFESWKQQKDEEIKSKKSKVKKEEKEKKSREVNDRIEKSEDAKKVFENWKVKKDEQIKDQQKEKSKVKKKEQVEAKLDGVEKKQAAQRSYEAWKERKEKTRPLSASTALQQRPWCPSSRQKGNAIPDTVAPVIVRNKPPSPRTRTMSASSRLQNNSGKRSK